MSVRGLSPTLIIAFSAVFFFGLGSFLTARQTADSESEQIAALRAELGMLRRQHTEPALGHHRPCDRRRSRPRMDDREPRRDRRRRQARAEDRDGPAAGQLLRERRNSFVELNSYDDDRREQLRHRRLSRPRLLHHRQARRRRARADVPRVAQDHLDQDACTTGAPLAARIVDTGDAEVEVDPGDWAILKVKEAVDLPALDVEPRLRVRLRRSDLPARQRLLEGHHPVDRLRRPADAERPGDLPDRRPSRRVGRRRAEQRRRARRHPDRPDAGRLSLLVHPAAARRDVPEGAAADAASRASATRVRCRRSRTAGSLDVSSVAASRQPPLDFLLESPSVGS